VADAPGRGMNLAGVFDGRNAARGWRVRAEHLDDIAAAGFTTVGPVVAEPTLPGPGTGRCPASCGRSSLPIGAPIR